MSLLLLAAGSAPGQVRVNPTGVNVNAQGATTVFLTFGGLTGFEAVEAFWCGELEPAAPAVGLRCAPGTIFGQLPIRYDRSTASGSNGFTDIMTIPPSVARRAYQAAESGDNSAFYYVRRFRSVAGGPDQFVAVTCRMTGGGARSPLSLTDVRLSFLPDVPVLQVVQGQQPPEVVASIAYTGTGRLAGRWEIVRPGEELPTAADLLTEATLPLELRGTQRRFTQLARFNLFLPPAGRRVELPGPDPARLSTTVDGVYYLLLRIEASSDKEGNSDLAAVGAGQGVVTGGAVAGFPMPVLRYVVGSGQAGEQVESVPGALQLLSPAPGATSTDSAGLTFTWTTLVQAAEYRIEIDSPEGTRVLSALLPNPVGGYLAPPWLRGRIKDGRLRWRVIASDLGGREVGRSEWRQLSVR